MSTTTEQTTTTWTIDPQHTQVDFEVKHMMFAKVRGRFETLTGTIELSPEGQYEQSSVSAVVESASITTGEADRDAHLRSADFFDVERFPALRFESESVRRHAGGKLTVTGALTIRDVTHQIDLDVTELGAGVDPWGHERVAFSATATVDRRDFGLMWNQALETGGVLVGNEIKISLEVQAVKQE